MSANKCPIEMRKGLCGRVVMRDNRCLFHLDNKTQDEAGLFENEFLIELEKLEKSDVPAIDFTRFIFPRPVSFREREFVKPIIFDYAIFEKEFSCEHVKFDEVYFNKAKFSKATFFDTIIKYMCCIETEFDEAYFFSTQFDAALFSLSNFKKSSFSGSRFNWADINAIFKEKADFWGVRFETVDFSLAEFQGEVSFKRAKFLRPKSATFDNNDLSKVSFLYAEGLEEIRFIQVRWPKKGDRCKLIDEDNIAPPDPKIDWEGSEETYTNVAEIYRKLRKNYESKLRYTEAGDFFKGEMEMRRMAIAPKPELFSKLKRNLSTIAFYKLLSNYGESWKRVALWILLSFSLFALAHTVPILLNPPIDSQIQAIFYENLKRSIFVFFQLKSEDLLDVLERVWSGLLIGLSYIALRRQLERQR
jgi:uncharacterized protein YjbI with pentapeptide repeats